MAPSLPLDFLAQNWQFFDHGPVGAFFRARPLLQQWGIIPLDRPPAAVDQPAARLLGDFIRNRNFLRPQAVLPVGGRARGH